jgi:membrane protein involved in colicin uptake
MGDSGEGLIDNEAKIQERIDELQRDRERARKPRIANPELARQLESLQLARKEIVRALATATHARRKAQLTAALADVEKRISNLTA